MKVHSMNSIFHHDCQVILRIIFNHGHNSKVKSSYLKELLMKEFGESLGFHQCSQKNVSELVYDTTA